MALKIVVDWDRCESNAVCVRTAPELFQIDDQEQLQVLVESPSSPEQIELAEKAARRCPRRAIQLIEG